LVAGRHQIECLSHEAFELRVALIVHPFKPIPAFSGDHSEGTESGSGIEDHDGTHGIDDIRATCSGILPITSCFPLVGLPVGCLGWVMDDQGSGIFAVEDWHEGIAQPGGSKGRITDIPADVCVHWVNNDEVGMISLKDAFHKFKEGDAAFLCVVVILAIGDHHGDFLHGEVQVQAGVADDFMQVALIVFASEDYDLERASRADAKEGSSDRPMGGPLKDHGAFALPGRTNQ
jgi:hypothetical protein